MATILMMDDDRELVDAMRIVLESKGHVFRSAPDGERGLRLLRETNPDLIILDLMMNRYTEGFHVAQMLRDPSDDSPYASYREVPILVFSSIHKTTPFRFGAGNDALPVDAFLEKSIPPERLIETIDSLLDKKGKSQAAVS
jgi:CheY-like chemotaxis protein